ncbi:SRPBCC family protein [Rhodococcus sp. 24CO]|uniref:SRPBCC family protein n=1 Tax=Rhodococcus sp. 24CO TaxID=3117460 RepID=UPI003D33FA50
MVDILHRVGIKSSSVGDVYAALTTIDGLAGWWTRDTDGDPNIGGTLQFRFGEGRIEMTVAELQPDKRVLWEVTAGPEEWIGTRVVWDLRRDDDFTVVLFSHEGWKEPVEFLHHCSTKWALFLMSLKSMVETGTGAPDPRDVKIDNWN